jgi:hypothetical protein
MAAARSIAAAAGRRLERFGRFGIAETAADSGEHEGKYPLIS